MKLIEYKNMPYFNQNIWYIEDFRHKRNNNTINCRTISFDKIPNNFKLLVKIYSFSCLQRETFSTVKGKICNLTIFFDYINKIEPTWETLKNLHKNHILSFMEYLLDKNYDYKLKNIKIIAQVRVLINRLQKLYPMFVSDIDIDEVTKGYQRRLKGKEIENHKIKNIPEVVLEQFDKNIDKIDNKQDLLIAKIMRATGLRESNISNLKFDKCIVEYDNGTYLQIEQISKTRILNELLPINDELSRLIKEVSIEVKKISRNGVNKERYLFVNLSGKDIGKRLNMKSFITRLNKFAKENNIYDENENHFRFKTHQFRHTRSCEFINSGMELQEIRKWLSHLSEEMTLHYSIIDKNNILNQYRTMIKEEVLFNAKLSTKEEVNEASRNENIEIVTKKLGYCIKTSRITCDLVENMCINCSYKIDR